jgi:hypothetical protein
MDKKKPENKCPIEHPDGQNTDSFRLIPSSFSSSSSSSSSSSAFCINLQKASCCFVIQEGENE